MKSGPLEDVRLVPVFTCAVLQGSESGCRRGELGVCFDGKPAGLCQIDVPLSLIVRRVNRQPNGVIATDPDVRTRSTLVTLQIGMYSV